MEIQIFIDYTTFDLGSVVTLTTGIIIPAIKYYKKWSKRKQLVEIKDKKNRSIGEGD